MITTGDGTIRILVWIQMGTERRETILEIPAMNFEMMSECSARGGGTAIDKALEHIVLDWVSVQYGWGWVGAGMSRDYSSNEGCRSGGNGSYDFTCESSIPNTQTFQLRPHHDQQPTKPDLPE